MNEIKVLHAHNYYLQPGGEDTAFSAVVGLLRAQGQEVIEYIEDNQRIREMSQARVALQTVWSRESARKLADRLRQERPDIVHFHNIFPLISPSAYYACRRAGIPVIQSLDNPRLLCPSANFYRDGKLCEDCLGKTPPWPGIAHGCYHDSRLHTAVVAFMLSLHRWLKTWHSMVDFYLVATEFYKRKFIAGGLPAGKILVKPHFIHPDPGARPAGQPGDYALFIARLDPEKGVRTLLSAWKTLKDIPLKIRGSGQLEAEVNRFVLQNDLSGTVEVVGRLSRDELTQKVKNARFLVWPSEGYCETFGYVAVESFSCGVPVIASRIGVLSEVVTDGFTGLHYHPGDQQDLAAKVRWAWEHPAEMAEMGGNARRQYETRYTAETNYTMLMGIYQRAIQAARQGRAC
jgi:glycosyltransferase involved in cell wall biosynthesis